MKSCTIIINHYESLPFIRACVRQIRKYKNDSIDQHIIIADQSGSVYKDVYEEFGRDADISVVWCKPLYSGYGLDWILRYADIETDYICQVHTDIVPISKQWLLLPITLIEENNLSFVGQLQFIAHGNDNIYPPHPFFAMAQCFNVAKTETYKEMSIEAGFTRFHNRPDSGLTFLNDDWAQWASENYGARGSDDDVVAFAWQDRHREVNKLGLAVTGFISPNFGRIIEDTVFHFCSARESIGVDMGERYNSFTKRINENYSDELINEMVELAKANKPNGSEILSRNFWDGKLKQSSPPSEQLNNRIEELKR